MAVSETPVASTTEPVATEMVTIAATLREKTGKGNNRKLRKTGKIPGVFLERGKSTSIELDPKLLPKAMKNGKKLNITLDGATKAVTIQEILIHPIKRHAMHVDLLASSN